MPFKGGIQVVYIRFNVYKFNYLNNSLFNIIRY